MGWLNIKNLNGTIMTVVVYDCFQKDYGSVLKFMERHYL